MKKKVIEYFKNEPAVLYYIMLASALIVPVIVSVIVFFVRGES